MTTLVLTDVTTWVGKYDFTGDMNELALSFEADEKDATPFGAHGRVRAAGLEDVSSTEKGFWQSDIGLVDPTAFAMNGAGVYVATHSPDGLVGSVAYTYQATQFRYEIGDKIGEVLPFSLALKSASGNGQPGAIRGLVAKAKGTQSATGVVGSAVQLGAQSATQYLYVALHVFTAGTTISLKVQSDDNAGFSSPTDVVGATLGPITTAGGTWMTRVAGPRSDTYYRLNATACTGTFTLGAVIGIR